MRSPFQKALSASFIALALGFAASASEIPGVYLPLNDVSLGGVANVNGNFTVTLPGNTVQPSVDGGGMLSGVGGALELHGAITADIDATASGSFSTTIPLATLPLAVIPVSGSVSILPIVGLIGTISGTVEAGARFAMIEQFETSFDLSLDSGGMHASQMGSPNNVHRFAKPVVSGSTQANVEISVVAGVTFQILFNGFPIGGPTAGRAIHDRDDRRSDRESVVGGERVVLHDDELHGPRASCCSRRRSGRSRRSTSRTPADRSRCCPLRTTAGRASLRARIGRGSDVGPRVARRLPGHGPRRRHRESRVPREARCRRHAGVGRSAASCCRSAPCVRSASRPRSTGTS
jgi:hypothetical protein